MSFAFGVFDMAKHYGVLPDLGLQVVAGEPATAVTGGGLSCYVPYDLEAIQTASLIIIPNWRDPAGPPAARCSATVRAAHGRGARVAGLCSGAFVLAAAGLLDDAGHHALGAGRRLAQMYPKVQVRADQLYIDDGDVADRGWRRGRDGPGPAPAARALRGGRGQPPGPCHGGTAAPARRSGSVHQVPVARTRRQRAGGRDDDLGARSPRPAPAGRRARPPGRDEPAKFDRRFREITGTAALTWLTHQRVLRAQQLLEATRLPVEEVARRCGFSSSAGPAPALQAGHRDRPGRLPGHVRPPS